jgi:predicted nucleic-acid-binding protein
LTKLRVDANVLLRFLTGEPEALAQRAAQVILRAERGETRLVLSPLVIAEMIWVLKSFYKRSHREIAGVLIPLLSADGVEVEEGDTMLRAIELIRDLNVSFVDAVLSLEADRQGEMVCTFDETHFKRLPGRWVVPT